MVMVLIFRTQVFFFFLLGRGHMCIHTSGCVRRGGAQQQRVCWTFSGASSETGRGRTRSTRAGEKDCEEEAWRDGAVHRTLEGRPFVYPAAWDAGEREIAMWRSEELRLGMVRQHVESVEQRLQTKQKLLCIPRPPMTPLLRRSWFRALVTCARRTVFSRSAFVHFFFVCVCVLDNEC